MDRLFFMLGSAMMFLGVGAGAFGAHGLSSYLAQHDLADTFATAVRYHIYHALALFIAAWAASKWPGSLPTWAGYLFFIGILLFSGSLYLLVFTRARWLGAITPLGGFAFLSGWALIFLTAWRAQ
ncbi:MAG: DUF423 domain-containing protein [Anaerolineales bacterium]|nr:DUF423 domain-containing protein [Anaerolineales bacterium]MCA9977581.1 DUF423 domain-containing protein [Anaerolineales bacterium]MCB8967732.1 DUF423 domain-containing protein [Ardenticatenaceae bacterium]